MNRTDLRDIFPNVIIFNKRVEVHVSRDESYTFSRDVWDFFCEELDDLIKMDSRLKSRVYDLWGPHPTKCARIKELRGCRKAVMEIYPGPHMGEWKVSFYETDEDGDVINEKFITHLRTATGQGSDDRRKKLRYIFAKIT